METVIHPQTHTIIRKTNMLGQKVYTFFVPETKIIILFLHINIMHMFSAILLVLFSYKIYQTRAAERSCMTDDNFKCMLQENRAMPNRYICFRFFFRLYPSLKLVDHIWDCQHLSFRAATLFCT